MFFSWQKTKRPILALAPIAGFTDSAFRQIVKSLTKDIVCFSELTSSNGLQHESKRTERMLEFDKSENPLIIQLFGNNPDFFVKSAKKLEKLGIAGIDINMGCPARKVTRNEQGSALIKNPYLAAKIVEELKKHTKFDISVKTRIGYHEYKEEDFINFCKGIENAGADLLTIHGRTVAQGFSGEANWDPIYLLKEKLKIPIIGNGDIDSPEKALEKLKNLDGIMVGRATFGDPWILAAISAAIKGEKYEIPTCMEEKIPLILKHLRINIKNKNEKGGILEMRKHLLAYIKGFRDASKFRSLLMQVETAKEVEEIFNQILNLK